MAWTVYNPRTARPKPDRLQITLEASSGGFRLSPLAMETLGYPRAVALVYDPETYSIMLRPPQPGEHAQSVSRDPRKNGRDAGHLSGRGFCNSFGITPKKTTPLDARREGNGLVIVLPPEMRPPEEGTVSPNGQREPVGTTA